MLSGFIVILVLPIVAAKLAKASALLVSIGLRALNIVVPAYNPIPASKGTLEGKGKRGEVESVLLSLSNSNQVVLPFNPGVFTS